MGLDTYLYKVEIKAEVEQIFDKLVDAKEEQVEVLYWRKNYELLTWFNENVCEMENCKDYEITKEIFEKWLYDLENDNLNYVEEVNDDEYRYEEMNRDMEMIEKILKETDFTKTKFIIHNWW